MAELAEVVFTGWRRDGRYQFITKGNFGRGA
jgi:hypothetical protein